MADAGRFKGGLAANAAVRFEVRLPLTLPMDCLALWSLVNMLLTWGSVVVAV